MSVLSGLDRISLGEVPFLRGKRVGLIANPSAIDRNYNHAIDVVLQSGAKLVALFGPEHGLRGDAQDMISVTGEVDSKTGIAVHSLYGHTYETLTPTSESLAGLDAIVFDVQDVGSRYYTFIWTMVLAMRAAARAKIATVVLDRPNPINGATIEGGLIEPGFESFVGLESCSNRHGLTVGEVARWRKDVEKIDVDLHVIEMKGWQRSMYFEQTGLPWVMPSPNMPTVDTAVVYPGLCLIEGTEVSEGRGTTRPFELLGAPYIVSEALTAQMATYKLPGIVFRPTGTRPMFQKHGGKICSGMQLHVTDRQTFLPYKTAIAILHALRSLYPNEFEWRKKAYEFVDKIPAIDLLCGNAKIREGIDNGASLGELAATWKQGEAAWKDMRAPYLMY